MKTTSLATGPIVDPGGATKIDQSVNVTLRLEVLSAPGTAEGPGLVRLQATYEKIAASSKNNSSNQDTAAPEEQYQKLEGRSIEFTLHPDGKIMDLTGLEDVITDPSRAAAVDQWLSQLTLGASAPRKGIIVGEKWSSKQPLDNVPLTGVVWSTESTYQRNEPCPMAGMNADASSGAVRPVTPMAAPEECAIILTHSETRDGHRGRDRTPTAYRKNGLRTSGEWKGTGETLTAISLRTGIVMGVTQSGTAHMDFTVTAAASGNHIRYADDMRSESQITLLSETEIP